MSHAALWYITFFLVASFIIVLLAFLQSIQRLKKITQLATALRVKEQALTGAKQQVELLQKKISQQDDESKSHDIDSVTQLMSWRLFIHGFDERIKEARRYGLTMALLLVNVDEITIISDALGYEIGRRLLKEVADRLALSIRDVDSVTRFEDNAFALLLSQIAKPETAVIVVQRILQAFKRPFLIQDQELYVTASVGISIYPNDAKSSEGLMNCAQHALALARRVGKNNYHFYQEYMHRHSQQELILQTNLTKGIFNDDFKVYYQPIVDASEERLAILEVLPFWYRAMVGTMNAAELLNYAEKYQKLDALFEWLLKNACQDFLRMQKDYRLNQSLAAVFHSELVSPVMLKPDKVAIPIAINQLNSHFIYNISQTIQTLPFDPQHLLLEIKCGSEALSFDVLEKAFNMLTYLKIKVAITHFGQESLSLAYLRKIKPAYIKLDPLMITDVTVNPRTQQLLEAIIYLAERMQTQLIVSGIELKEQYALMKEMGVRLMEGPYIGLPMAQIEMGYSHKALST